MSLNTFSAFVDFAIRSESSGLEYFIRSEGELNGRGRDALRRFGAEAEKNVRQLRAVLRENVTELVMEPCAAIDESCYISACLPAGAAQAGERSRADLPGTSQAPDWKHSLAILEKQRDFLRAAAKAVNLREVRRTFEKMADTKDRLLLEYRR